MPKTKITGHVQADIVAVSGGTDSRWRWRIISRDGHLLQQSAQTFPSLVDALVDGRRQLADELGAPSPGPADDDLGVSSHPERQ